MDDDLGLQRWSITWWCGTARVRELSRHRDDAGLAALAAAITPNENGKGALAPGAQVYLMSNQATEAGKQAVRDATKDCGRNVYL